MAIPLSSAYLAEAAKAVNCPNTILEVVLDSGTVYLGYHGRNVIAATQYLADGTYYADGSILAGGSDELPVSVQPVLKSVSSFQNKLDPKAGYSTRGQITFTIVGRDNFKSLVANSYLKNRRVTRKDGFIASGFTYGDYASTFTGKIVDWSRKGDELTITVQDDLVDASKKLPVENATKTQSLDFRNTNPADIMSNLLLTQLGMAAGLVNSTQFTFERDTWLNGWVFDRVVTEPTAANDLLNELQQETNSFVFHDGEKVSLKVFAPPVPGQTIEAWTDEKDILSGSLSCKSGYKDAFYNRVVVYYDYDESGSDGEPNFEAAVIAADSASQDASQWSEASTKVIKSKWMRSRTYTQPSTITGVVIYHASRNNGAGGGTLAFTAATQSLTWTPPNGATIGEAVKVTQDGKFQVFGADKTKWMRVIVTYASLPVIDKSDTITLTPLSGESYATSLAGKILNRYRDPAASVSFDVSINKCGYGGAFIKPTDLKDLTTDEAFEKGETTWTAERVMLTAVRPDMEKGVIHIEAQESRQYRVYGFVAPTGTPDYGSATAAQKKYAFVGDVNNKVGGGTVDGYYVW